MSGRSYPISGDSITSTMSTKQHILYLRELGSTWDSIAAHYGIGKATIWKYYKQNILPKNKEARRKLGLLDTRPGAIRITFEEHIDEHKARDLIVDKLPTKERGMALLKLAKEK